MAITTNELNANLEFEAAVEGLTFPASKEQLLEAARTNFADGELLDVLEDLPVLNYTSANQVLQTIGTFYRQS